MGSGKRITFYMGGSVMIRIPEGYEEITMNVGDTNEIIMIAYRKKKPETRWFRVYQKNDGLVNMIGNVRNEHKDNWKYRESEEEFKCWITPWTEYEI